jgi:hypothetical protein
MTRTIPALGALAVTFSLVLFALLQRSAATPPAASEVCLAEPAVAAEPAVPVTDLASCGEETVLASAGAR